MSVSHEVHHASFSEREFSQNNTSLEVSSSRDETFLLPPMVVVKKCGCSVVEALVYGVLSYDCFSGMVNTRL